MNLVETYVTKIWSERLVEECNFPLYELVAETDCWGRKEHKKHLFVNEADYKSIKEKGYYLT